MRRAGRLALLLSIALFVPAVSVAAVQVGARGGYAHARGDVFPGSGSLGGSGLYGFTFAFGVLPHIDLEMAWERYRKEFHFSEAEFEESFFAGRGKYEDQAYLLTGKIGLPLATLLDLYVGGGGSLHHADLTIQSDGPTARAFVRKVNGIRDDWEWHAVIGTQLRIAKSPVLAYGELRFQDITGETDLRTNSVYAGLNLVFE